MQGDQPTIFISSTIYDFGDLRGALKFWLEELGYRVQLSEFNDFDKPIEQNSYDACLDAIRNANWFVLLVGGRRGGWYSRSERVSITQKEYQVAYEQCRMGHLQVLPFVRRSIWDWCDNYARATSEASERGNAAVVEFLKHQSRDVDDPEYVAAFLREIRRTDDMRAAVISEGRLPVGNWVYQFNTFREIADAIQIALRIRTDVSTASLIALSVVELRDFLASVSFKWASGDCGFYPSLVEKIRDRYPTTYANTMDGVVIKMPRKPDFGRIFSFILWNARQTPYDISALERLAFAPGLMDVNVIESRVVASDLQAAVRRTLFAIRRIVSDGYRTAFGSLFTQVLTVAGATKGHETAGMRTLDLVGVLAMADQMQRAILESLNLLGHLEFALPLATNPASQVPVTPLVDQLDNIAEQEPSREAVEDLIRSTLGVNASAKL